MLSQVFFKILVKKVKNGDSACKNEYFFEKNCFYGFLFIPSNEISMLKPISITVQKFSFFLEEPP